MEYMPKRHQNQLLVWILPPCAYLALDWADYP
jgi:hypothetical protein